MSRPQVNDASTDESSQQFVTRAQVYDTDTDAVTVTDESRQQFRTQQPMGAEFIKYMSIVSPTTP